VESNESNAIKDEPPHREAELSELAARALSDFARILAAEARLLETDLVAAAQSLLDRLYIEAILIVLAAVGVVALVTSFALVLHHWLHWWQVMGLLGVCAIVAAVALRRLLAPNPAFRSSRPVTEPQ
jgi:hypothetical protein